MSDEHRIARWLAWGALAAADVFLAASALASPESLSSKFGMIAGIFGLNALILGVVSVK